MASEKTPVIHYLFFKYWDPVARNLTKSVMSSDDVVDAIRDCNAKLSVKNPANFLKDVIRGQNASANWPKEISALRYTARQVPGDGNVFKFVPYAVDQIEPFPDKYRPTENTKRYPIQSISMSIESKKVGRADEPWLIQTAINLRVIESHFALVSSLPIAQLTHLQMSVKLRKTEIDALFLAMLDSHENELSRAIITCEAKQYRERILEDQLVEQTRAAFASTDVDLIVPIGLRAVRKKGFYIAEFSPVSRSEAESLETLVLATEAVYELQPSVPGI